MPSGKYRRQTVVPEAVRGFDLEDTGSAGMTTFVVKTNEVKQEENRK